MVGALVPFPGGGFGVWGPPRCVFPLCVGSLSHVSLSPGGVLGFGARPYMCLPLPVYRGYGVTEPCVLFPGGGCWDLGSPQTCALPIHEGYGVVEPCILFPGCMCWDFGSPHTCAPPPMIGVCGVTEPCILFPERVFWALGHVHTYIPP